MYYDVCIHRRGGKVYRREFIRESFRRNGKVCKRTTGKAGWNRKGSKHAKHNRLREWMADNMTYGAKPVTAGSDASVGCVR